MMNKSLALLLILLFCGQSDALSAQKTKGLSSGITGQVSAPDGTPLAGARVDIATAAPKVGRSMFCPSCYLDCRKSDTTDEHGKFHLNDLNEQLKFRLVVSASGYKTFQTKLLDPTEGPVDVVLQNSPKIDRKSVV